MNTITVTPKFMTRAYDVTDRIWGKWCYWDTFEEAEEIAKYKSSAGWFDVQLAVDYYDLQGNYIAWNEGHIYRSGRKLGEQKDE